MDFITGFILLCPIYLFCLYIYYKCQSISNYIDYLLSIKELKQLEQQVLSLLEKNKYGKYKIPQKNVNKFKKKIQNFIGFESLDEVDNLFKVFDPLLLAYLIEE
jgi:hypothetical protein